MRIFSCIQYFHVNEIFQVTGRLQFRLVWKQQESDAGGAGLNAISI